MKRCLVFLCAVTVISLYILASISQVLALPTYTIRNGSTIIDVDPLSKAESPIEYYSYNSSVPYSGNPDFGTVEDTGFFWLYEDTTTGKISLGMIFDSPNSYSGGNVNITITGVPVSGYIEVVDDPKLYGIRDTFTTTNGKWIWGGYHTDGGVIGGLDNLWEITITLNRSSGITDWFFLSGNSTTPNQIPLNMNDGLIITASTPVPEPGSLLLLGLSLIGLVACRKRPKFMCR